MTNPLIACPIRYTANLSGMRRQLDALGASPLAETADAQPTSTVTTDAVTYALGSGLFELRPVSADDPRNGKTELQFVGDADDVVAPDGVRVQVVPGAVGAPPDSGLAVLPIWYTHDTAFAIDTLTGLGAVRRIVADNGVWNDFVCPGGGFVAVHTHPTAGVEIGFEFAGDLDALLADLLDAGFEATIVDEAYTRVLHLPDPDGGPAWQINHRQSDLYGFTDLSG